MSAFWVIARREQSQYLLIELAMACGLSASPLPPTLPLKQHSTTELHLKLIWLSRASFLITQEDFQIQLLCRHPVCCFFFPCNLLFFSRCQLQCVHVGGETNFGEEEMCSFKPWTI